MTKKSKKVLWISIFFVVLIGGMGVGLVGIHYYTFTRANLSSINGQPHSYYIYPGTTMDSVCQLIDKDYRARVSTAWRYHSRKTYAQTAKPGFYTLPARMCDRYVLRVFQVGEQTPIKLTFTNSIRTRKDLAGKLSSQLMLDSTELITRLDSDLYMQQFGMTSETALAMFVPNTYEVYWSQTADELFQRMHTEYEHFWNEERLSKAEKIGLTPVEVSILASIVEGETYRTSEQPTVASVYLNRLKKNMRLESCPTVIYATGDLGLRRVLYEHLHFDSPYNTYLYAGLPPGPIRCPLPSTIDAVLSAPETNYLFMCANPDFSGTHIFSATYAKHAAVAREYQRQLNKKGI